MWPKLSEPILDTTKFFTENYLSIEMKKKTKQVFMNKSVNLELSILELSKRVLYEFWYDYVKLKYGEKVKLLYGYRQFHCVHEN